VVTPRQQLAPEYVVGVSCPHCAGKDTDKMQAPSPTSENAAAQ
jgi:UPF0176 protein